MLNSAYQYKGNNFNTWISHLSSWRYTLLFANKEWKDLARYRNGGWSKMVFLISEFFDLDTENEKTG